MRPVQGLFLMDTKALMHIAEMLGDRDGARAELNRWVHGVHLDRDFASSFALLRAQVLS